MQYPEAMDTHGQGLPSRPMPFESQRSVRFSANFGDEPTGVNCFGKGARFRQRRSRHGIRSIAIPTRHRAFLGNLLDP